MNVSVIIPTLNAEQWLDRLLSCLASQTAEAEILVVDSGSGDATCRIAAAYADRVRLLTVPREEFDHGGTRDYALRRSHGEFVVFLTQDALPADEKTIEKLLSPFSDERIGAVYGRQVAREDAPGYEKWTRAFNYPETGRTWGKEDIPRYGIKAFFFSNTCSAYRRSAYESAGGFDTGLPTNEDMLIAAKLLQAGWKLRYEPEAVVLHSHTDTLGEEYRRNVRIGEVLERYRDRLADARPAGEGIRMVRFVSGKLLKEKRGHQIPVYLAHAAARLAGYRAGRRGARRKRGKNETVSAAVQL